MMRPNVATKGRDLLPMRFEVFAVGLAITYVWYFLNRDHSVALSLSVPGVWFLLEIGFIVLNFLCERSVVCAMAQLGISVVSFCPILLLEVL
jgi:hypothetical protein